MSGLMRNRRKRADVESPRSGRFTWLSWRHFVIFIFEFVVVGAFVVFELLVAGHQKPPDVQSPDSKEVIRVISDQREVIDRTVPLLALIGAQVALAVGWVILVDMRAEKLEDELKEHKQDMITALGISEIQFRSGDAWEQFSDMVRNYSQLRQGQERDARVFSRLAEIELEHAREVLQNLNHRTYDQDSSPQNFFMAAWNPIVEAAEAGTAIVAISAVNPQWWRDNPEWWQANLRLLERGVVLIRIFAIADKPTADELKIMQEQSRGGVQVNIVQRSSLPQEIGDTLICGCTIDDWINPENSRKTVTGGIIAGTEELNPRDLTSWTRLKVVGTDQMASITSAMTQVLRASRRFEDPEWYRYFFDEDYIHIMEPRNRSAAREVQFITDVLKLQQGQHILDCGAGYGRIAGNLQEKIRCDIDAIEPSIAMANKGRRDTPRVSGCKLKWIDQGMEELEATEEYDAIISIFTSFGYFLDPTVDIDVLKRFHKALKPGGLLLIDIDNWAAIDRSHHEIKEIVNVNGGTAIVRRIDGVEDRGIGKRRLTQFVLEHAGSVRSLPLVTVQMYRDDELSGHLTACGFSVRETYGDYDTTVPYSPNNSDRLIILAEKPAH
jgi:SAM-dependent methyltransferase